MATIRILLADDHAVLRTGLRMLVDSQPDMKVVAEAANGREAVRKVEETAPDVALVDLTMPGMSGIEAIGRIRERYPRTRVLVLTMHDDPAYVHAVLSHGASGHVVKDVDGAELLSAIRAVYRGRTFVDLTPRRDALTSPRAQLTSRETQVLKFLAEGFTNRQIAERLLLSVKTVETYRARIGEKLGLQGRADLVRFARDTGLLVPPGADGPGA
jgi:two-component system, NarL family, response regulator NreC